MGWETINYSCGHSDRIQLYGKMTARDARVAELERGLCPDCEKKRRDEENAKVAAAAAEAGFPELSGSPKQVAWAESIRLAAMQKLADTQLHEIERISEEGLAALGKTREKYRADFRAFLLRKKTAGWWIDHKGGHLLDDAAREYTQMIIEKLQKK